MLNEIDNRLKARIDAFSPDDKVEVRINIAGIHPDKKIDDWERYVSQRCFTDPNKMAGLLMDLSLTHYVWDWCVSEFRGEDGKQLLIELLLAPSAKYNTNIDADLIYVLMKRLEGNK